MTIISRCFLTISFFLLTSGAQALDYNPNNLFIKMKNDRRLNSSKNIKNSQELITGLYLVETNNLVELEEEVLTWDIEYIQRDHTYQNDPFPELKSSNFPPSLEWSKTISRESFNDEFIKRIWAFDDKWGMSVSKAYSSLPPWGPMEVIVAVIDTGVDYNHEDLKNIMWRNTKEIPDDGIDNDGNGYIDDVYGINTVVRRRFNNRATTDPMASHWHGTHVAGTIAAESNNGVGIAGVAHNVKIMAIRSIPNGSDENDSNIVESLLYAAKNGARIINCSFGKKRTEGMVVRDIINSIGKDFGVLVVAASGNYSMGPFSWYDIDSRPQYPASLDSPNLLTVTATNNKGVLANFSNIGKRSVDLAAPGNNIFSTVNKDKYSESSGTSMAAPNASGVAAMVLGYFPELTPMELKTILMKTVKKSSALEGKMIAPGVINLASALREAAEYREKRWK